MKDEPKSTNFLGAPLGSAERAMEEQYLRERGYDPDHFDQVPAEERNRLLKEAAIYASSKLEEIDAEVRMVHKLHEAGGTGHSAVD